MDFGVQGVYGSVLTKCFNLFFEEKKIYPQKDPLKFFGVQNMSHRNGSSTFIFQVMGFLKLVTGSVDKGLRLSHSKMVGCHSLAKIITLDAN